MANLTTIDDFVNKIREHLKESNINAAIEAITASRDDPSLHQNCLQEILPIITAHIHEDVEKNNPALFNNCVLLLDVITENFEPEDILLYLMEDVQEARDDVAFLTFLNPLQKVLLRLPKNKRLNSFSWGLYAVQFYLKNLPLPEDQNLSQDEEVLMDADPAVERISSLYLSVVEFYGILIEDFKLSDSDGESSQKRRAILYKFLLQLLGKPLAYLDLKWAGKTKSRGRRVAEALVESILEFNRDLFWWIELEIDDDTEAIDDLTLANLCYMVLVENVSSDRIPKVYDQIYVFQNVLHLVAEFLRHDKQFLVYKGLQLAEVLLVVTEGLVFSYQLLDSGSHCRFCTNLTNVIIYHPQEQHRKKGLEIFHKYLFRFEAQGRYLLVYNLMKILNHTGIIGYLITQYKDMIMQEFNSNPEDFSVYFSGQNLFTLLDMFCYLHKGEESDIVELADQIVASLNLLRYLAIRDKGNMTKIWDRFKVLGVRYLEPLKKGVILSRAHYELKIKELKMEEGDDQGDDSVSLIVSGQKLNKLSRDEKLNVCYSALTSFDVIESLLSRLNELIEIGL